MTVTDLAIIAGLAFAWGTLSARLERFDMTPPVVFTAAGVLLAHGRWRRWGGARHRGSEGAGRGRLVLVLFPDASQVGLHQLRADLGLCLRTMTTAVHHPTSA